MFRNIYINKFCSYLIIITLILSCVCINPVKSNAYTVEETVTKYHLDIGAQHIWGSGASAETATYDHQKGGTINVSQTITMPENVSNVKIYEYRTNSSKFNWKTDSFNRNTYLNGQSDYTDRYADFVSTSLTNLKVNSNGNKVTFSYTAKLESNKDFDLKEKLNNGFVDFVFEVLGGRDYVYSSQRNVYDKLIAGSQGKLASNVYGFMYFTPVIIQYDVKEMVTYPDPVAESIEADLQLPSAVKVGELYNASDISRIGSDTTVASAKLYRTIEGETELIDTYLGDGRKGQNTGGVTSQSYDKITSIKYTLVVTSTNGLEDSCSKTINIEDGRSFTGDVDLIVIPNITHEGHPVDALDNSTYTITENDESRDVSASYAYSEGFASNRYVASDGRVQKDKYDAIVTFPKKGVYPITLEVRLKGNSDKLTDTKNVEVLKTPYIYDTLSGTQKQNRKQTLTFKIATYPGFPITNWELDIKDLKSNELASLSNDNLSFVGNTIKTRDAKVEVLDEYWTQITVDFLTKYPRYSLTGDSEQNFSYKLKVEDSKGGKDDAYKGFPVAPDKPPVPIINMQSVYTRNITTNTSTLQAECLSESDGDSLERIWGIAEHNPLTNLAVGQINSKADIPNASFNNAIDYPNYANIGFGTDQKIRFNKDGVGITSLKLHLKDVWTEPTLEEFIKPSDYLEAETVAQTTTINIAPVVSIEPLDLLNANLLIMTNKATLQAERNNINAINVDMIEKNIDANITVNEVESTEPFEAISGYTQIASSENYQYCTWYQDATLLRAYDRKGNVKWKFNIPAGDGITYLHPSILKFNVDQKEKYGVLVYQLYKNDDREYIQYTTILNAKTGVPIKTYEKVITYRPNNMKLYINNDENVMYMVLDISSNAEYKGLCRFDLNTGKITVVDKKTPLSPQIINGKLTYFKEFGTLSYGINAIDLKTEEMTTRMIPYLRIDKNPYQDTSSGLNTIYYDGYDNVIFNSGNISVSVDLNTGKQALYNSNTTYYRQTINGNSVYRYFYKPNGNFVVDNLGKFKYGYINTSCQYIDKSKGLHSLNTAFFSLDDFELVSWEEYEEILSKIKNNELIKNQDIDKEDYDYKLYNSLKKYTVLNTNNTYLLMKNIGEYGDKVKDFIEQNGIRLIESLSDSISDTLNEDLTSKSDLALRLKGDKTNVASITKNLNLDSGKTYSYSYDMNIKSGAATDLLNITGSPTISTSAGKTYYKEIVYKEDYTRGSSSASKYVDFLGGVFNTGSYFYGAGYGGTKLRKNSSGGRNGVGGPSMAFHLEKNGYIDLTFWNDAGAIYIYIDGELAQFNNTPERTRMLKLLNAGDHTLRVEDAHNYNEDSKVISTLEIGYIYDSTNVNQTSFIKDNNNGSYHLEGSFNVPNDILYTTNRTYKAMNVVKFDANNCGQIPSSGRYDAFGFKGNLEGFLSLNDTSSSRKYDAFIKPTGNGVNFGGRGTKFDMTIKNPYNSWMIFAFQWGGTTQTWNNPKCTVHDSTYQSKGECQSLASTRSGTRGGQSTDKIHKVWYIIPPNGSASFLQNNSGSDGAYGGWWSMWNVKYATFSESDIKQFMSPNIKLDDAQVNGFFSYNMMDSTNYPSTIRNLDTLNVIDLFSLGDRLILDKYTNLTPDCKENLSLSTVNSTGIDAYITNLKIQEKGNKYGFSDVLQNRNFNYLNALNNNGWNKSTKGTGIVSIEDAVKPIDEDDTLIYKKGQLVKYGINYSDYENDPQNVNKSYWIYAHTPYNDGEHEQAGIIYDEDGKIKKVCGEDVSRQNLTIEQALEKAQAKGTKTLSEYIPKFYVDGKYTVYHWEYDDTSRGTVAGGYPSYDKSSNMAELTFYVQGTASAPWITDISTSPVKVKENEHYSINVSIDDAEKDVLKLTTEVYKDKKLIFTHRKKNIHPIDAKGREVEYGGYKYVSSIYTKDPDTNEVKQFNSYTYVDDKFMAKTGEVIRGYNADTRCIENIPVSEESEPIGYPVTNTGALPQKAQAGKYEVVCTVRDQTGADFDTYKFIVVSEGKIIGQVYHTEQWDINRKKYNLSWFKNEVNTTYSYSEYLSLKLPRKRGTNVFWSGEKFMLNAAVAGTPTKVTCSINGTTYNTTMHSTGKKNNLGETIYIGTLWDDSMINKWGNKNPQELTFHFVAVYSGGTNKNNDVKVIVDNMNPYWRLHRAF